MHSTEQDCALCPCHVLCMYVFWWPFAFIFNFQTQLRSQSYQTCNANAVAEQCQGKGKMSSYLEDASVCSYSAWPIGMVASVVDSWIGLERNAASWVRQATLSGLLTDICRTQTLGVIQKLYNFPQGVCAPNITFPCFRSKWMQSKNASKGKTTRDGYMCFICSYRISVAQTILNKAQKWQSTRMLPTGRHLLITEN